MGISRGCVFNGQSHDPALPSLFAKANILIDQAGHARLADFGLLTIVSDPENNLSSSSHAQGGTYRWMSPERIAPEQFGFKDGRPTIPSDCHALGMVIYETISGSPPFYKHTNFQVYTKILKGEKPHRGVRFTEDLWKMLERCWAIEPKKRPGIEEVLQCLETDSGSLQPPSLGVNEEMEEGDGRGSPSGSSGVPDGVGDTAMTESTTAMSSDSSYPTDPPLSPASTTSGSMISINPNNGRPRQVSAV